MSLFKKIGVYFSAINFILALLFFGFSSAIGEESGSVYKDAQLASLLFLLIGLSVLFFMWSIKKLINIDKNKV